MGRTNPMLLTLKYGKTTTLDQRPGTSFCPVRALDWRGRRSSQSYCIPDDNTGLGFIHKSKQNSSGSFSIGKTWNLRDLRGLEVLDVRGTSRCPALSIK